MSANRRISPIKPTEVSLKKVINSLMLSYQPVAVKQNSFFINDIPQELNVEADKEVFSTLMGSLLYVVARCSRDTCIRVSAKAYENAILLYVKDTSTRNNYRILSRLQHLQILADKLGGFFHLSGQHDEATNIAFSLPNKLAA